MVTWLYNTVYNLYSRLPGSVKDFVHSVLSGLLGALNAVAGNMWTVWWYMVDAATSLPGVIAYVFNYLYRAVWWLLTVFVLDVYRNLARLDKWIIDHYKRALAYADQLISDLTAKAWGWVQDAITWVNQHVWTPLWGYVQDLYDKMTRWAYTAYYYVTHPAALAELVFWSLWDVFTRNAFDVARIVGEWALRMVLQNSVTGVKLVEQIVTDVL